MLSRRTFLATAAATAFSLAAPAETLARGLERRITANPPHDAGGAFAALAERKLSLVNPHTGEAFDDVYWAQGAYVPDALAELERLLRDYRRDEVAPIDRDLLDVLARLQTRLDLDDPIQVMSGYRSPATNAAMRRRNHNAARNSYHMQGMAVDISVPRLGVRKLRRAAIELRAGGVGTYPGAHFIHLDVGPVRVW